MPESAVGAGGIAVIPGSTQTVYPQWFGMYYGTVSSNADPLGLGRCQIRVPQVLGTEISPWAWALTTLSSTTSTAAASTSPPPVGTVVGVLFLGGDLSNPAYLLLTTSATTVTTSTTTTTGTTTTGTSGTPSATPSITTTSLANGTVSTAYYQPLAVSGGTAPYTYAVTSGSLPSWATLNASTGVISGTPTANGTSTFTLSVTDAAGNVTTESVTLTVGSSAPGAPGVMAVTTVELPTAQVSQAYSATLAATGGTGSGFTWSVTSGTLPAGLALDTSTGAITGTATGSASTGSVVVTVTDSGSNTASQTLAMVVITGPNTGPSGSWTLAMAEEFDYGYVTPYGTGPNPNLWSDRYINGDLGRSPGSPNVEWAPHGYYGHSVSDSVWTSTAQYQNASAIDPTAGNALAVDGGSVASSGLTFTAAALSGHLGFAFTYGYIEARVMQPSPTSSWCAFWMLSRGYIWPPEIDIAEWQPPGYSGQNQLGYYNMAASWQSYYQAGDENWDIWGCEITSSTVTYWKNGTEVTTHSYDGNAFPWYPIISHGIQGASGGSGYPSEYSVDYIRAWVPAGVPAQPVISAISPSTGIPSGGDVTVTFGAVAGATSYRVTASPTDTIQDNIDTYGNDQNGLGGSGYSATGSSSPITVTGLPSGGRWNFTVCAINSTGYSQESAPFGPQVINIQMATPVLPNATTGTAYSATMTAQAGVTPYTWSVSAGSLPAGLSLDASSGVISGTPTGSGASTFTIEVSGGTGWTGGATSANSASQQYTISVGAGSSTSTGGGSTSTGGGSTSGSVLPSWDQANAGDWTMVFDDEFPGTSLNTTFWGVGWDGGEGPINSSETVTYNPANVTVSGGYLNLALTGTSGNNGACVTTNTNGTGGSTGFASGPPVAIEASINVQGATTGGDVGVYNWPGWWTDGQSWPADGEIDIMEGLDGYAAYHIHDSSNPNGVGGNVGSTSSYIGWHTFGCYRQSGTVDFYYDGVLVGSENTDGFTEPHYLILDYTCSAGEGDPTGVMQVDWVRAWTPG